MLRDLSSTPGRRELILLTGALTGNIISAEQSGRGQRCSIDLDKRAAYAFFIRSAKLDNPAAPQYLLRDATFSVASCIATPQKYTSTRNGMHQSCIFLSCRSDEEFFMMPWFSSAPTAYQALTRRCQLLPEELQTRKVYQLCQY